MEAEFDYKQKMIDDLPQQFRDRELIEALYDTIAVQMQEVYEFFDDLKTLRFLNTAAGAQLDRIGEIVVMTREEASTIYGSQGVLSDEAYRKALIYKTFVNFGDATYKDIVSCIRILRDGLLGFSYSEDPAYPATIILETEDGVFSENFTAIANTPIPRAGGVGLLLRSNETIDTNILHGFVSHLVETRSVDMPPFDVGNEVSWYVNELEEILADENNNILVDG